MSSAICFNLDQPKMLSSGSGLTSPLLLAATVTLTHSHIMTPFDAPGKQAF